MRRVRRGPRDSRAPGRQLEYPGLFTFALTFANSLLRLVPSEFTATMMATAMPAAIRPYSIAVAPPSSRRKDFRMLIAVLPKIGARATASLADRIGQSLPSRHG